jgi:cytochrome oxidase assembly protein ShyY1
VTKDFSDDIAGKSIKQQVLNMFVVCILQITFNLGNWQVYFDEEKNNANAWVGEMHYSINANNDQ